MTTKVHVTSAASTIRRALVRSNVIDAPRRTLRLDDKGASVERLQRALKVLGYDVPLNGRFDARTRDAVKAFQTTRSDVPDSGVYGPGTRDALAAALRARDARRGPQLKDGFSGAAVRQLESALAKRGLLAKGKVDGVFDAATRQAVQKLEKKHGLKVDGVVDPRVWKALGGATSGSGPTLRRGAESLAVKALQTRLKDLGLYSGKVTGRFDAATVRAVKAFEKNEGMKADGVVTGTTWRRLRVHVLSRKLVGGPKLKKGYRGSAVRILEARLKARGLFKGKVDGVFDDKTKAAVQRFERRLGVKADGVVGNALWEKFGGAGLGSGPKLKVGSDGATVKILQRSLKARGLYKGPIDGDFGPMTQRAVKALERRAGLKADGVAGNEVWRALRRHVLTGKVPTSWRTMKAPPHDYRRVSRNGEVMNVRTMVMLRRAESFAKKMGVKVPFFIVQGSYSTSVAASGGTHDRGGALDIRTRGRPRSEVVKMVKALRMAGFAAWKRGYGGDSFSPHIHAIAIGDRQLSSSARSQVREYFAGGDGLVGSAPDGDRNEAGRPIPKWAERYR